jgi:hypothetical protein
MLRICTVSLLAVVGLVSFVHAEVSPMVRATAVRRTAVIAVDGHLDDAAWASAPRYAGFVQRFPKEANPPSLETRFSIVYDDEAVFVGVWADDPQPDLIRALLTRRDVSSSADAVTVGIDSYHDRRTAYAFQLNAAGVQRDMLLFDDSNQDDTWDAVWTGKVALNLSGWTAEYRIPLSQLRYGSREVQEWGFQVMRLIGRTGEEDWWSPTPRSSPQVVSKFGVVEGITNLKASRRLELLPYVTGGVERLPVEAGDPVNDTTNWKRNVGLDLKYGLGPAFTVSATLNPDFGQVEADPSSINLSANELFFAEKRTFFLEGSELFRLPIGNSDNTVEGAFYSRRIGAAPAEPDVDYDYLKAPSATAIYGAAKLTGKTPSGWSVGVLDAVTGEESAELAVGETVTRPVVAPLTNYAIARIKRDLRDGKTTLGASATAVNRKLDGSGLDGLMHDQAYTGGAQLQHRWADDAWTANVSLLGSYVHGSAAAITETQENPRHYFQRADAPHIHVDPTRTSLAGMNAKWMIGQLGDTKHWRFGFGGDLRTPGLELNDAGFQRNADAMVPFLLASYHDTVPGEHLLNWDVGGDVFLMSDFEPRLNDYGLEYNANAQFASYWKVSAGGFIENTRWFTNALRGGPSLRADAALGNYLNIETDTRKAIKFSLSSNWFRNLVSGTTDANIDLGATLQARSNLDIFIGPGAYWRRDFTQYIDEATDMDGQAHYILGRIRQTNVAMTLRVNWTFSPHLALQAYAQPFVASGRYSQLKDVDNPAARKYGDRFHVLSSDEVQLVDDVYQVTRNGEQYSFDRPDFNFRQLRSTVVVRWEYRPGSTVFAIWSHGRTDEDLRDGRLRLGRDLGDLGNAPGENVVMVKANYWIGL